MPKITTDVDGTKYAQYGEGAGPFQTVQVNWIVGTNMPGYLPDSEPNAFERFEDACEALMDEFDTDLEANDNYLESAALNEAMTILRKLKHSGMQREFSLTVSNRAYWIAKA